MSEKCERCEFLQLTVDGFNDLTTDMHAFNGRLVVDNTALRAVAEAGAKLVGDGWVDGGKFYMKVKREEFDALVEALAEMEPK